MEKLLPYPNTLKKAPETGGKQVCSYPGFRPIRPKSEPDLLKCAPGGLDKKPAIKCPYRVQRAAPARVVRVHRA
jgi:hypothetical protein